MTLPGSIPYAVFLRGATDFLFEKTLEMLRILELGDRHILSAKYFTEGNPCCSAIPESQYSFSNCSKRMSTSLLSSSRVMNWRSYSGTGLCPIR